MARSKKQMLNQTEDQLKVFIVSKIKEIITVNFLQKDAKSKGSCYLTEFGLKVHCAEPIPDHDWKGSEQRQFDPS